MNTLALSHIYNLNQLSLYIKLSFNSFYNFTLSTIN